MQKNEVLKNIESGLIRKDNFSVQQFFSYVYNRLSIWRASNYLKVVTHRHTEKHNSFNNNDLFK